MTWDAVVAAMLLWLAAPRQPRRTCGRGSEAAVGANGTGEACRVRVVQDEPGARLPAAELYCDGWSMPSGTLFRFRVSREFTPERILTDSTFQRGYETRLGGCGAVEATTLGDGTAAAIRQCTRLDGGWPVVVVAAVVGRPRGRAGDLPDQRAPARGRARRVPGQGACRTPRATGTLSPAIRRAETIVGASGKLVGIQDIGAADALWRLGRLQYRSGNYAAGEAAFVRLLEIHERVLGVDKPGGAAILNELALTVGHQARYDEADRIFVEVRDRRAVLAGRRAAHPVRLPGLRPPRPQSGRGAAPGPSRR